MLPSSHQAPIQGHAASADTALLAEAFTAFIQASARLEHSYRDLQVEVAELSQALLERNQALTESRSRNEAMEVQLQQILHAMPCGVLVAERDGTICLANAEAERLLGLLPARWQGQLCMEHLLGPAWACGAEIHNGEEEGEWAEQEFAMQTDGGRRWLAVRSVSLGTHTAPAAAGGQQVYVVRDVSSRKRQESEREGARDAVAQAQVSAILAHEIRNPLASLELFAGLLAEDSSQASEWLAHLRAGIRSLSGIVNNVLALHGNMGSHAELLDPRAEIRVAADLLQPLAWQAGIALGIGGDAQTAAIRCNRSALQQVLFNLSANAFRHTPAGGSVQLSSYADPASPGRIFVRVSDTGLGIPAEDLPHIFELGFSGTGTTSGLGLAVCRQLLAPHQAQITATSRPGVGSTFTVEFPCA